MMEKRYIKTASLVPRPDIEIGIKVTILVIANKKDTVIKLIGCPIAITKRYA